MSYPDSWILVISDNVMSVDYHGGMVIHSSPYSNPVSIEFDCDSKHSILGLLQHHLSHQYSAMAQGYPSPSVQIEMWRVDVNGDIINGIEYDDCMVTNIDYADVGFGNNRIQVKINFIATKIKPRKLTRPLSEKK